MERCRRLADLFAVAAGKLLAHVLDHLADRYARDGVPLSLSTLADQVGGCCAVLAPLIRRIERHVL